LNKPYLALPLFFMLAVGPDYIYAQTTALANPGNMVSYRGDDYTSYYFLVTATSSGTVWGGCNNPFSYTDNSNIGTALVHFWGLTFGEQWVVQVKVLPGLSSYVGCDNNGITSSTYGSWPGSFQLINYWSPTLPAVTTNTPGNITETGATVACNAGGLGNGSSITIRGACWNTSGSPTTSDSKTDDGVGTGDYTSTISGLTSNIKYYVRAYAINNLGQTGYGAEYSFTTITSVSIATGSGLMHYTLPKTEHVAVRVYDMSGGIVSIVLNERKSAGQYSVNLARIGIHPGMYIVTFASGGYRVNKKMVLMR
jgi:hypothetical protein